MENMENKSAKISDEYLKIETLSDLGEYIKKKYKGLFSVVGFDGDDAIDAYADDAFVRIIYDRGKMLVLLTEKGYSEQHEKLRKIVAPIMWYKDPEIEDKFPGYCPILSYDSDDFHIVEWQYEYPFDRVKGVVFDMAHGENYENLKLYYPPYKLDDFKEEIKYGKFTCGIPYNAIDRIKNCREFELYLLIRQYFQKYDKLLDAKKHGVDVDEPLNAIKYDISFLYQQAAKFGVKTNPPSDKYQMPSDEFEAWFAWWDRAFPELVSKDPRLAFDFMSKKPLKIDTKPEGSFMQYLDEVKAKRKESQQGREKTEMMLEKIEELADKVISGEVSYQEALEFIEKNADEKGDE